MDFAGKVCPATLNRAAAFMFSPRSDPLQQVKAVTLDVGGTLIQCWPSVGHIYAEVAFGAGAGRIDAGVLETRFKEAWMKFPDFQHTRGQWRELVDRTFEGLTPDPPSATFFSVLYQRFAEPAAWHVFEDVVPALEQMRRRGIRLGVISNWDERLRPLLERLGLAKYFEVIVVSSEVGASKPQPLPFCVAARQLGLSPAEALHIGDSYRMDVQGAEAAGMRGLLIDRTGEESSVRGISDLRELLE